jgi:hypothetical protein
MSSDFSKAVASTYSTSSNAETPMEPVRRYHDLIYRVLSFAERKPLRRRWVEQD